MGSVPLGEQDGAAAPQPACAARRIGSVRPLVDEMGAGRAAAEGEHVRRGDQRTGRPSRSIAARGGAALGALLAAVAGAASPSAAAGPDEGARPTIRAVRLEAAPTIDGDVLGDEAWTEVPAATEFWQTRPFAGEPASERTEVRLAFTRTTLYVGVVCFDREPDEIVVSDARRDASLADTDSFQIIVDAFRDHQNGFVFGTNPAGIEYDGQLMNEATGGGFGSGGGRFGGGSGSGFNVNWDGSWSVAARIGEYGWSAELAIPFATLRYPRGEDAATWGVNFQRNIRRRNETAYWSPLEQQFNLYRLIDAGTIEGLEVPGQRNLKVTPYLSATTRRPPTGSGDVEDDFESGVDLKYGLTPSLTLDATYNTDFAQVEVDEQQINLDRFNLFFPEKRPFFLENAGLFTVGASGEAELFFSRRIGIAEDGSPIPIEAGGRISGKVGRTNVGLLDMRTESTDEFHANNYAVARVSRELPNRSNLGGLYVERSGKGSLAPDGDRNRTLAVDGKLGLGEYQEVAAWAARTETPGIDDEDHAFEASWGLTSPDWLASVGYLEVGEGFNPEVGFLARRSFRKPSGVVLRRLRPQHLLGFHELRPHVSYSGHWDFDGNQESELVHLDSHWEWRSGYELHTGYNLTYERVKTAFAIAPGVDVTPGEYSHAEVQLVFNTDAGEPVSYSNRVIIGGFFGGNRTNLVNTMRLRRSEALTSEITWDWNDVNLPGGSFDVNLGRLRLSYAPTPRLLVQLLTQYNDRTDQVSSNLRFGWLREANTGLYVVYNEIDEFGADPLFVRADRSVIVKYSHLLDVFR
jgi:hypothetical protein